MTARRPSRRRRRAERSPGVTLALAAGLAAVTVGFAWVALRAPTSPPLRSTYTLHARFSDLASLSNHGDIRIAGRRVGQILRPRSEAGFAVADLQLDTSVGKLRDDTRLRVRSQGLLGQRYLELLPGRRGRRLAEDAWIPARQSAATVEVTDLLSTFDARRRRALAGTIDALGTGTLGRGPDLNGAFRDAPPVLADLRTVARSILARGPAAARLFPALRSAAAAANPARHDIATGFEPEAAALRPLARQRRSVARALEIAPGALLRTRQGLAATDPLLIELGALANALRDLLRPAPVAFGQTRALLAEARRPFRDAATLAVSVDPTVRSVLRLTRAAQPELPRLTRSLTAALPPLRSLGARPCDVLGWAANWASMLSWGIGKGGEVGPLNVFRLELIGNNESVGGVREAPGLRNGKNPYPAPCVAGTEQRP